ncbi:MAG: NAD(P)/FAD-dependent oxidoreductase [Bacillota bacterium]
MFKVVIIGAGPAGVTVAETLRMLDDQCEIVMLSGEPYPPYSPPAMAEYFLTGKAVHFWKGEDFPKSFRLDYRSGECVLEIDPQRRLVILAGGQKLSYDKLVIAAGSRLYAPIDGSDKDGIHNFKSLQAGEKLLGLVRSREVKSALIVGAGFIGVEIALLLQAMGLEVKMLVRSRVMREMLDPETSQLVLEMLEERGIRILRGDDADAIAFSGIKKAESVLMRSGKEHRADLLVAATGLKPNIELLSESGIETDWGVLVDDRLCTNFPEIYAAGDIAETIDRISGKRYAHANYPNAVAQGNVVGRNILEQDITYSGSDSMNSLKHLGIPVIAAGMMEGDELRVRHNGCLRKLWVNDNRLVGFRLTGDINCAGIYLSLIRRASDIAPIREMLLEPNFSYAYLMDMALAPDSLQY